jgi:hypothetical protein
MKSQTELEEKSVSGPNIDKQEALLLLEEAMSRISREPPNAKDLGWQCGGAYWRVAQVLEYYLLPRLEAEEGKEHAEFILRTHGKITR